MDCGPRRWCILLSISGFGRFFIGCNMAEHEVAMARLQRKLDKKDKRIERLEQHIARLEHTLACRTLDLKSITPDVTKAVSDALCNVRMIPVMGSPKRLEVKVVE